VRLLASYRRKPMSLRPHTANAKIVQAFRGEARSPLPLHPLEKALVLMACLHLCFLPWALGARAPWAQIVSLVFGLVCLGLATIPRRYEGELAPQGAFTLHPWSRLLKFPVFWLGGLFFAYVACQAINFAYFRASAGIYWWLAPAEHTGWLPSGVKTTFEQMNAWRMLAIWGGAWALGCALWVGLTRRVAVQRIVTVLVANGTVLALVGILQKVTGTHEILWWIKPAHFYFVATFFYKNHGGAYFNLIAVLAIALMAWHHIRSLRRLERSSPAPVFAFAAIVLAALVLMSGSRASMILLAGFVLLAGGVYLVWRVRHREGTSHPALTGLAAAASVALVAGAAWFLNLEKSIDQVKLLATEQGQRTSIYSRVLAREATVDLFLDSPVTGWGAGSFRHIFPIAQRSYPDILTTQHNGKKMLVWDNAHNDYVQALAELGLVGFAFPALMLFWALAKLFRLGIFGHPAHLLYALGLGVPLAHAWVDFPLNNCAIFVTVCAAWILLLRWLELENAR
jgi:O-antigen ligase